jgi:hypothetical protein
MSLKYARWLMSNSSLQCSERVYAFIVLLHFLSTVRSTFYSIGVHMKAKEAFSSGVSQFGEIFCTLKSTVIFLLG